MSANSASSLSSTRPTKPAAHPLGPYRPASTQVRTFDLHVLLGAHPATPWPIGQATDDTGCYSLRYRLANNNANHGDIRIEWCLGDEFLDTFHNGVLRVSPRSPRVVRPS